MAGHGAPQRVGTGLKRHGQRRRLAGLDQRRPLASHQARRSRGRGTAPVFFTTNLTLPSAPFFVDRPMWNSFSVTVIVFVLALTVRPDSGGRRAEQSDREGGRDGGWAHQLMSRCTHSLTIGLIYHPAAREPSRPGDRPSAAGGAAPIVAASRRVTSRGRRSTTPSASCNGLNRRGAIATVDVLGEEVRERGQGAAPAAGQYRDVFARIDDERLDANVSVKLTGFGLKVDGELCRENRRRDRRSTLRRAATSCASTWRTRRRPTRRSPLRELRDAGHDERRGRAAGVSAPHVCRRAAASSNARLCKGIYVEPPSHRVPATPTRCGELRRGASTRCRREAPTSASRPTTRADRRGVAHRRDAASRATATSSRCCSACVTERADELVAGRPPCARLRALREQWYEYSLRRLQENPKIAGYVAADTVGRLVGRR